MKYFGTDGIRGTYGTAPVNDVFFQCLGDAVRRQFPEIKKLVIGRDTRASGENLTCAFLQGFGNTAELIDLGEVSSPILSQSVGLFKADFGVMITASHNPYRDNGIKFFDKNGDKISQQLEQKIESKINFPNQSLEKQLFSVYDPYIREYPYRVVVDCANGSATNFAKFAYRFQHTIWIGDNPNGQNINDQCGSEYPQQLVNRVINEGYDLGIAHDGDGDRVVLCDRLGRLIPGEVILGVLAISMKKEGKLRNLSVVTTPVSNMGLANSLAKLGIAVEYSDVGDRNVAETMRCKGCNLGGESSGHIILRDLAPTSDGILTALSFLEALKNLNVSPEKVDELIQLYPQKKCNIVVRQKVPLENIDVVWNRLEELRNELHPSGRIFVRYSGTEPKLRIVVEAQSEALAEYYISEIKNIIENCHEII